MLIGYARVSTDDQYLDNQRTVLTSVGCQRIYEEKIPWQKAKHPTRLLTLRSITGKPTCAIPCSSLIAALEDLLS